MSDRLHTFGQHQDDPYSGSESESSTSSVKRTRKPRRYQGEVPLNANKERRLHNVGRKGSRRHKRWANSHFYLNSLHSGSVDAKGQHLKSSTATRLELSMLNWYSDQLGTNNTKREFARLYEERNLAFFDPLRSVDVDVHEKMMQFLQECLDEGKPRRGKGSSSEEGSDSDSDWSDDQETEQSEVQKADQHGSSVGSSIGSSSSSSNSGSSMLGSTSSFDMEEGVEVVELDSDYTESEWESETDQGFTSSASTGKAHASGASSMTEEERVAARAAARRRRRRRKRYVPKMAPSTVRLLERVVHHDFVTSIDEAVYGFVQENRQHPAKKKGYVNVDCEPLVLDLPISFHRLVAHHIADYYGLESESFWTLDDQRMMRVSFPAKYHRRRIPASRLKDYVVLQLDSMALAKRTASGGKGSPEPQGKDGSPSRTPGTATSGSELSDSSNRSSRSRNIRARLKKERKAKRRIKANQNTIDGIPVWE